MTEKRNRKNHPGETNPAFTSPAPTIKQEENNQALKTEENKKEEKQKTNRPLKKSRFVTIDNGHGKKIKISR